MPERESNGAPVVTVGACLPEFTEQRGDVEQREFGQVLVLDLAVREAPFDRLEIQFHPASVDPVS